MRNQKGSILVITLGFIAVFTLMGFGSIYFATMQHELADKERMSAQAFWLADGGIERAKLKLPSFIQTATSLGDGTYSFFTASCPNPIDPQLPECICNGIPCVHRWKAESTGTVNGKTRSIQAVISKITVNALTANGTINGTCDSEGSAQINGTCVSNANVTMNSVFGLTYSNDHNGNISISRGGLSYTFHSYTNGGSNDYAKNNANYQGLTVITSDTTVMSNQINTSSQIQNTAATPGFLIIDCSNSVSTCFKSTGNINFYGIIWVIGNVNMTGNPSIQGSLFVENGSFDGHQSGNNSVEYDENSIYAVLNNLGLGFANHPTIISWKEI